MNNENFCVLIEKVKNYNDKKFVLCDIYIIPQNLKKMYNSSKNNIDFCEENSIFKSTIIVSNDKKIFILSFDIIDYIQTVTQFVRKYDQKSILWINIPIDHQDIYHYLDILIENNYSNPYISLINPCYIKIKPSLILINKNVKNVYDLTYNLAKYAIQQYNISTTNCYIYCKFSDNALKLLKSAPLKLGYDDQIQKEISGNIDVVDIKYDNTHFVYIFDIIDKKFNKGSTENVKVPLTRYNFHTHPKQVYDKYGYKYAWPSLTDFLGVISLGENTIFHCVTTVEGLYIISFGSYWSKNISQIDKNFVKSNYDIGYEQKLNPKEFVEKINHIKYKKYPIFKTYFIKHNSNEIFKIFYPQKNSSCLSTQIVKNTYNELYN